MNTESKGKWVAEAFDALRLQHRLGNRGLGLVLLMVGWALLLWLFAQLPPDNGPRVLGIPIISWSNGLIISQRDVALTDLVVPGGLIILLWWLFRSGSHITLTYPLMRILSAVGYYLALILLIVVGLFSIPVVLTLMLVHATRRRLRSVDAARPPSERRADREDPYWRWFERLGDRLLRPFAPTARVAFSPPVTFSLDEDLLGAKASLQMLMEAYGRLRDTLASLDPRLDFRLVLLPETVRVAKPQQARRMRALLGQDALLWTSYVDTQPPRLWVNVEMIHHVPWDDKAEITVPDTHFSLFQAVARPPLASVQVLQSDPTDAYILLLLTLSRVARQRLTYSWSGPLISRRPVVLSPLINQAHALDRFTLLHLLERVLPSIREPIPWRGGEPTAKRLLIAECLHWAARQLQDWEDGRIDANAKTISALYPLLVRCATLAPDNADAHYMLAVCQCVRGEAEDALVSIARGQNCDLLARYPGPYYMTAMVEITLERTTPVRCALAAVYAAIALQLDRDYAFDNLRKKVFERFETQFVLREPARNGGEQTLFLLLDLDPTTAASEDSGYRVPGA